ncbi:MAG: 30S ribosomal protein S2, partial [Actinomycetota bacterium]|nr:30S ribosomal protein S2 [Actinomycetota bacterium]
MDKLPQAVFVLDTPKEHIAVAEANRLKLPVVAVADSNSDPDFIDYVIPGNDDAIRSTELLTRVVADAVREGRYIAENKGVVVSSSGERSPEQEARVSAEQAEAAQKTLAEAAAREARIAAEQAALATPVVDPPAEAAADVDDVPTEETSIEEPSETPEEN